MCSTTQIGLGKGCDRTAGRQTFWASESFPLPNTGWIWQFLPFFHLTSLALTPEQFDYNLISQGNISTHFSLLVPLAFARGQQPVDDALAQRSDVRLARP